MLCRSKWTPWLTKHLPWLHPFHLLLRFLLTEISILTLWDRCLPPWSMFLTLRPDFKHAKELSNNTQTILRHNNLRWICLKRWSSITEWILLQSGRGMLKTKEAISKRRWLISSAISKANLTPLTKCWLVWMKLLQLLLLQEKLTSRL